MLEKVKNKATEIWDDHGDEITHAAIIGLFGYTMWNLGKFAGYLEMFGAVLEGVSEAMDKKE